MTLKLAFKKGRYTGPDNPNYVSVNKDKEAGKGGVPEVVPQPRLDAYKLGEAVKKYRQSRGLNMTQMVQVCEYKLSVSTLSRIEAKLRPPDVSAYIRLCWVLGVPLDHFVVKARIPGVGIRSVKADPIVGLMDLLSEDTELTAEQKQSLLDMFAAGYRAAIASKKAK
jgi:transcriptional regulator with XRE-family HTH domain